MVSALVAVLATGAVVAVRVVSDGRGGELRLVTPVQLPTGTQTSEASPSTSPSPSPKATPTSNKTHFVSEDGTWEFWYPKSWFGPTTGSRAWDIQNFEDNPASVPLAVAIRFSIYENHDNLTFEELRAELCRDSRSQDILECRTDDINGRTWVWVDAYSEAEGPVRVLRVALISGNEIYDAIGYVPGKSGHEPGIKQISEVFESFVLRT